MSDTTTITPEERVRLRSILSERGNPQVEDRIILRLLNTAEQAEDRAEKAEAENARLNKMVDWLAGQLHGFGPKYGDVICPQEKCHATRDCIDCWKEAARRAVADAEREVKG